MTVRSLFFQFDRYCPTPLHRTQLLIPFKPVQRQPAGQLRKGELQRSTGAGNFHLSQPVADVGAGGWRPQLRPSLSRPIRAASLQRRQIRLDAAAAAAAQAISGDCSPNEGLSATSAGGDLVADRRPAETLHAAHSGAAAAQLSRHRAHRCRIIDLEMQGRRLRGRRRPRRARGATRDAPETFKNKWREGGARE